MSYYVRGETPEKASINNTDTSLWNSYFNILANRDGATACTDTQSSQGRERTSSNQSPVAVDLRARPAVAVLWLF